MERYRLKNIIILILVLVNLSLLSSLFYRQSKQQELLRRTEDELISLFAASDIDLSRNAISWTAPSACISMTRSTEREKNMAEMLLGSDFQETSQSGLNTYYTAADSLQIRANGTFEAKLSHAPQDTENFCRTFCSTFSFSEPVFSVDEEGSGSALAICRHGGKSVYNANAVFTLERGQITAVTGTLLPESGIGKEDENLLSCSAALTTFLQMRLSEGTVGSSILDTYPCYELQNTASSPLTLESAWCIETDVASYYVNCVSGTITVG